MPVSPRASAVPSPPVLEVRQIWEGTVLEAHHFRPSVGEVRVGSRLGWRWELLGVDMGFVPEPMHKVLPWLPPIWSEVRMASHDAFTVGEDELGGAEQHTLFRYDESRGWLVLPPGGDPVVVDEQAFELQLGPTLFQIRVVDAARATPRGAWSVDLTLAATTGVMAGIGLCFGILVALAPPPAEISILDDDDHGTMALLRLPPKPPEEKKPEPVVEKEPVPEAGPTTTTRGRRDHDRPERGGNKGLKTREIEEARQAGIFAGGGLDAIMGADSNLSAELVSAASGIFAKGEGGAGIGVNGLGDRRGGLGGGGGVDGLGDVGVWGPGGPPGSGDGPGLGGGDKEMRGPGGIGGTPILIGNMDRAAVDAVVKRHLNAIRYCYQRELTKSPNLSGKLAIKFTIAKDGTVSMAKAKTNTLGNDAVEQCVVGQFHRMQFPEPQGGGIALVTYPFLFAPG